MKKQYITAVLEILGTGKDISDVLSGLQKTLESRGHMSIYASVLRGVLVQLSSATTSATAVVTVSDSDQLATQKEYINSALTTLGASDDFETVIDPTIIGGTVVSYKNVILDQSYKTTLTNLYRSITQ